MWDVFMYCMYLTELASLIYIEQGEFQILEETHEHVFFIQM